MAPQVVNDRYVQLNPAYSGGPNMAERRGDPESRTAVPISVDGIIDSLDDLAKALGPNGANAHGALSRLVASSAHAFGPNGAALHSTLDSLGSALGALSSKSPQLTALFDNLGNLSKVASQYTGTYQAFANDLAVVSTELASDDGDIGSALSNLQQALGHSRSSSGPTDPLSGRASRTSKPSPAQSPPSSSSSLRSSAIFRRRSTTSPRRRSDRARRSRSAVEVRPDERICSLLQVGVRQRAAPPAAPVSRQLRTRSRPSTSDAA